MIFSLSLCLCISVSGNQSSPVKTEKHSPSQTEAKESLWDKVDSVNSEENLKVICPEAQVYVCCSKLKNIKEEGGADGDIQVDATFSAWMKDLMNRFTNEVQTCMHVYWNWYVYVLMRGLPWLADCHVEAQVASGICSNASMGIHSLCILTCPRADQIETVFTPICCSMCLMWSTCKTWGSHVALSAAANTTVHCAPRKTPQLPLPAACMHTSYPCTGTNALCLVVSMNHHIRGILGQCGWEGCMAFSAEATDRDL